MDITEARAHAGALILDGDNTPRWVEDRARQVIPHYIWTWQEGRRKRGECTACGTIFDDLGREDVRRPDDYAHDGEFMGAQKYSFFVNNWDGTPHHKSTGCCPRCGAWVEFRSLAKGYSSLEDKLFLVIYQRSAVDKNAIVCVGYRIFIPWREMEEWRYPETPMYVTPMEICVFRWGKGGQRFIRDVAWYRLDRRIGTVGRREVWSRTAIDTWTRRKRCDSGYTGQNPTYGNDDTAVVLDVTAWQDAIEGTLWQTVTDDIPYTDASMWHDHITLADRVSRYPCVEYLCKLGYTEIAAAVVDGKCADLINRKGKNARSVLRLTEDEWGWIKGHKARVTMDLLEIIRFRRRYKLRMSMELCKRVADSRDYYSLCRLHQDYPQIDTVKACKYAYKQRARLSDYRDYLEQCARLGADTTDRAVLWPRDLHEIHQRYTIQLQQIEEERRARDQAAAQKKRMDTAEGLAEEIAKRARELAARYTFRACGLVMQPFASGTDIIQEGAAQSICIGSYVERYASGGTILCTLRHEDRPDEPFHAVEFSAQSGAMIQCRGRKNKTLDVDEQLIRDFWAAWDAARGTVTTVSITIEPTPKTIKEAAA